MAKINKCALVAVALAAAAVVSTNARAEDTVSAQQKVQKMRAAYHACQVALDSVRVNLRGSYYNVIKSRPMSPCLPLNNGSGFGAFIMSDGAPTIQEPQYDPLTMSAQDVGNSVQVATSSASNFVKDQSSGSPAFDNLFGIFGKDLKPYGVTYTLMLKDRRVVEEEISERFFKDGDVPVGFMVRSADQPVTALPSNPAQAACQLAIQVGLPNIANQ